MKVAGHDKLLMTFAPEQMDAVSKVGLFSCSGIADSKKYKDGIKSTSDHLEKFRTLAELANDLIPGFDFDRKELNDNGYSPAKFSRKFAAVAECCLNELYAALDGVRDVIYGVYKPVQGVQKKSTEKFFSKAYKNEYGNGFPETINNLLSDSYTKWFSRLRAYRTEFTHGSLGSCHKDDNSNKITYMHSGLGTNGKSLIIEDFCAYINEVYSEVINLQEKIFEFFYTELDLSETKVLCGIYKGLAYMRSISPVKDLNMHSGICLSTEYNVLCPISNICGAFKANTRE